MNPVGISPVVQYLVAGAALADVSKPILPGADITSQDLPNGPKPMEALKGDAGSKVQAVTMSQLSFDFIMHLDQFDNDQLTINPA